MDKSLRAFVVSQLGHWKAEELQKWLQYKWRAISYMHVRETNVDVDVPV